MLDQHDPDGACLTGHTLLLQGGKEQLFFFSVVALVGEELEELQQAVQRLRGHFFAAVELFRHLFGDLQHAQDGIVFFSQNLGCRGHFLSSGCVVLRSAVRPILWPLNCHPETPTGM